MQLLDVRDLEPPVPLKRILDALDILAKGDWLRVIHNREPYPLYNMLRQMGFAWLTKWCEGECIITIWHEGHPPQDDMD